MAQILLLESDRQTANLTKLYFGQAGHQLSHYADPQSAVASADIMRPDIVIVDLLLASRSGVEFLYELRSYPEWQNIPVIATGHLPAAEIQAFQGSLQQLKVAKYIQKQNSSLADLLAETERLLQPAKI
jgi:DNA-binding response OmpR family regulator